MSNTGSSELGADEKYEIAVSYGTIISTGVLAILVCSTRLYVRKYVINAFGIDDWACLVGLISVTMFNGVGLAVVHYGVGKHIQHVSQEHLKMWFLLYYICICMYLFVSLAVKSSILLLLRRVFPTPYIQHTTLGLIIFLVLFTISGSIVGAFQCTPPKYAYQLEFLMSPDRAKYCFSTDVTYGIFMYQAATLFACDIIIFLLPFPALMKLHIGSAKKTALLLVFGSGLVACIAPAIRFESIQFYKSGSSDTTYAGASSLYWMAIEYNLGLVAGSLAGLRPLVSKVVTALRSSRGNSAYKSNQFTPSYQLENCDNKHWNSSERSGTKNSRYQGDSVLEATVLGDRNSDDSGRQHILKTQSVSIITEESGDVSSLGNARLPWQGLDQKK
ncbi:hypothetical protein CGCSCA4_v001425 [Colletotrichum siamense]|uniref:Rhodopsin domain-containing protein n=1 Tax=Colletotrichum siamense TaxID=690259 RepID=A0A9P5KA04_COLSI|nr:uncharacterized protein CGCS363_v011197 [Colletotrichum siamense]KAF4855297.1 hypothetical protein CGCSCA4_v001425 [Colletotrichum siamense]KAF4865167.1 hypothetical protein CGCSCA2_v001547 [Colletotrichum siamense]KAF5491798.1 hypothetical protein CGCS363_v011197 [Colletotrichum siamense]